MKKLSGVLLLLFSFSALSSQPPHTAAQVSQMIKDKGAQATIRSMYDSNEWWDSIRKEITSGKSEWLTVASQLESGADADSAEDLIAFVGIAIQHNAPGVLAILDDKNTLLNNDYVCSFPDFSQTEAESNKIIVDSIKAMYKVDSPSAKRCLATMIHTLEISPPFQKDL